MQEEAHATIAAIERPEALEPSEHFKENLELIEKVNPALAKDLANVPLTNLQLGLNANGYLVGNSWDLHTQTWVPLCASDDPWGEAETDANAMWTPDMRVFTLFGFGLGYLAASLAKRLLPHQRLAIYDTRPQHYAAACRAVNLAQTLGEGGRRIDTFLGDTLDHSLQQWWLSFDSSEKFYIAAPVMCGFTTKIDADHYRRLMERTVEMHRYHMVGLATWQQFGPLIGDNDLGNLPEFASYPGLNELTDIWKGKPVVCIAAGPSLLKNLRVLTDPDLRSKVAVITVGTTYALVKALGITPDIVTTIDFQELNWGDQFKGIPLDDHTPLVYLHSTWPETPRRWPGPRFVALNASDTTGWIASYCEAKPHTAQVQTVAHLNLAVAYKMGANPIILMGQDLSMPVNQHHALGARVQDRSPEESHADHVEMLDYKGEKCFSRHSFLSMKLVFEQLIAMCNGTTFFNCTEGGLAIAGAENMPLKECLAGLPDEVAQLRPLLGRKFREYEPGTRWNDLGDDLGQLVSQVELFRDTAQEILDLQQEYLATNDADVKEAKQRAIVSKDAVFAKFPVAFGQFAVRNFKMVEALSKIPPLHTASQEEIGKFSKDRLVSIAEFLVSDAKTIIDLLHDTIDRFNDVRWSMALKDGDDVDLERLKEMIRRKSFHALELAIPKLTDKYRVRYQAILYRNQQCYQRAADLLEAWQLKPDAIKRCREMLRKHNAEMQLLRRVYYASKEDDVISMRAPATEVVAQIPPGSTNGQGEGIGENISAPNGEGLVPELIEELTHGSI